MWYEKYESKSYFLFFNNEIAKRGGAMRKIIAFSIFLFFLAGIAGTLSAGIIGDINNDGKIDLAEATYALQVTAGVYQT